MQFASKKVQTSETIDLGRFSEKITWLIRQIQGHEFDSVNVLRKNEAEIWSCKNRGWQKTEVNFSDANDLLEKIICKLTEVKIKKD